MAAERPKLSKSHSWLFFIWKLISFQYYGLQFFTKISIENVLPASGHSITIWIVVLALKPDRSNRPEVAQGFIFSCLPQNNWVHFFHEYINHESIFLCMCIVDTFSQFLHFGPGIRDLIGGTCQ